MNFYKRLFKTNIFVSVAYSLLFTIIISTFLFTIAKREYDKTLKNYLEYTSKNVDTCITNAWNVSELISTDTLIQKYANEKTPDYANRLVATRFLAKSCGTLLTDGCHLGVTKYYDNHIITSNFSSDFEYYCNTRGLNIAEVKNIMDNFISNSTSDVLFIPPSDNDTSFFIIVTRHTSDENVPFFVFAAYPTESLFSFDQYDSIVVNFLTRNNKLIYITNPEYTNIAKEYISEKQSNHTIHSYSFYAKNRMLDMAYHFIISDKQYYFRFIPIMLFTIFLCLPIFILGIILMKKITNNTYKPIKQLLDILPNKGKSIENEFDFVISEYHKLEIQNKNKNHLIGQFQLSSKDKFITNLLFGTLTEEQISNNLLQYKLPEITDNLVVVIIEYDDFNSLLQKLSRSGIYNLKTTINSYINELFTDKKVCMIAETSQSNHTIILSCSDIGKLKKTLQSALIQLSSDLSIDIYAAIGTTVNSYSLICDSYRAAVDVTRSRLLQYEHNTVLTTQDIGSDTENQILYLPDNESRIITAVASCHTEKLNEIINEVFCSNYVHSREAFAQLVIMLYSTIQKILYNLNLTEKDIFSDDTSVYLDLKSCKNLSALKTTTISHLNTIMSYVANKKNTLLTQRSSQMVEFVNENYTKDISLSDLAEYMNMTQGYASTIFKQETGTNFKEYLSQLRLKKATELMQQNPNMLLKDIAVAVGYNNTRALSRLLKKYE